MASDRSVTRPATAFRATDVPDAEPGQRGIADPLAQEIRRLRGSLENLLDGPWTKVAHVRQHQRIHMRTYQKNPDVIEVGINPWEAMYDWHVFFRQPIRMMRNAADGRYEMMFIDTRIVLRPDLEPDQVRIGYDVGQEPPRDQN